MEWGEGAIIIVVMYIYNFNMLVFCSSSLV